jgi:hypothetical protein
MSHEHLWALEHGRGRRSPAAPIKARGRCHHRRGIADGEERVRLRAEVSNSRAGGPSALVLLLPLTSAVAVMRSE